MIQSVNVVFVVIMSIEFTEVTLMRGSIFISNVLFM